MSAPEAAPITAPVAVCDGRVYAVRPGPNGIDAYEDVRLLATMQAGWLTSLTATGDVRLPRGL